MDNFETEVKKYKREFERLTKENAALYKKADEKPSMSDQLNTAQLQADYHNLKRFVDSLPEKVKRRNVYRTPNL
jgi:Skp family chaperone for outer membrane proteins